MHKVDHYDSYLGAISTQTHISCSRLQNLPCLHRLHMRLEVHVCRIQGMVIGTLQALDNALMHSEHLLTILVAPTDLRSRVANPQLRQAQHAASSTEWRSRFQANSSGRRTKAAAWGVYIGGYGEVSCGTEVFDQVEIAHLVNKSCHVCPCVSALSPSASFLPWVPTPETYDSCRYSGVEWQAALSALSRALQKGLKLPERAYNNALSRSAKAWQWQVALQLFQDTLPSHDAGRCHLLSFMKMEEKQGLNDTLEELDSTSEDGGQSKKSKKPMTFGKK